MNGSRKRTRNTIQNDDDDDDDDGSTTTTTAAPSPHKVFKVVGLPVHVLDALAAIPSLLLSPSSTHDDEEQEVEEEELEEQERGSTSTSTSSTEIEHHHEETRPTNISNNQPPENDTLLDPTFAIPYDSTSRWWNKRPTLATVTQMRKVTARLVMECPHFEIAALHHSPIELYVAWELHNINHQLVVEPKDPTAHASSFHVLPRRATMNIPDEGKSLLGTHGVVR
jgi:hypothetical protein